jgi:uncharacterized repeat protein (TIGR01451 family)
MPSHTRTRIALGAAIALVTGIAQAQGCIELRNAAEVEQEYVDADGRQAKRLVPAGKVVPGTEVIYTITARNVCDKPAENIVIGNPVPAHMSYVAASAIGAGTDITYSLDGKAFAAAEALTVHEADGSRPARANEYRHVRWVFKAPFAPGATAFVRYRATLD